MKKIISTLIITASLLSTALYSATLFEDSFDVTGSGTVNFGYDQAGRQNGTHTPVSYAYWYPTFNSTLVSDSGSSAGKLHLYYIDPDTGQTNDNWVGGPNTNFNGSSTFSIEFKITRLSNNSGQKFVLSFGKDHVPASYWTSGGMSISIDGTGKVILYRDSNHQIAQLWLGSVLSYSASPTVKVKYVVTHDSNGDAKVALFLNDVPYTFGDNKPFIYTYTGGFSDNYVNFQTWKGDFDIEYLKITTPDQTFNIKPWTSDADSEISDSKSYSHAIDCACGIDTTVNGVVFHGSTATSGTDWEIKTDTNATLPAVEVTQYGMIPNITGNGQFLVTNVFYDGNINPGLILSGLTPGQLYIFTLYLQGFGGDRYSYIATSDGQLSLENTSAYGDYNGQLITYQYKANEDGKFIFTSMTTNNAPLGLFAFSNVAIPEPVLFGILAILSLLLVRIK